MLKTITDYFQKFINDHQVNIVDVGAGSITVATILAYIPMVTSVLSLVWVVLRLVVLLRDEFIYKEKK